eukprot:scaffold291993_cov24-Tisochrysis_lutea.AAC.4
MIRAPPGPLIPGTSLTSGTAGAAAADARSGVELARVREWAPVCGSAGELARPGWREARSAAA